MNASCMFFINVVPEDEFTSNELKGTIFQCRNERREFCVQEIVLILFNYSLILKMVLGEIG